MPRERTRRSVVGDDERGQSVFDYSIGVSIFVIVVVGVLVFIPTAFGSFGAGTGSGPADGLAAQRGATFLTETVLDTQGSQSSLDTGCALLFFTGGTSHPDATVSPSECELDGPRTGTLEERLSLSETTSVNVTIERRYSAATGAPRRTACWDTADQDIVEFSVTDCGDDSDDVKFRGGSSLKGNPDFASADRYGTIGGTGYYVVVRVW